MALVVDEWGIRDERMKLAVPWSEVRSLSIGKYAQSVRLWLHRPERYLSADAKPTFWMWLNRNMGLQDADIVPFGLDQRPYDVIEAILKRHAAWQCRAAAEPHTTAVIPPST